MCRSIRLGAFGTLGRCESLHQRPAASHPWPSQSDDCAMGMRLSIGQSVCETQGQASPRADASEMESPTEGSRIISTARGRWGCGDSIIAEIKKAVVTRMTCLSISRTIHESLCGHHR